MSRKPVRGSSVVELALLTPFVLLVMMCFLQLGLIFIRQIQLQNLAATLARELAAASTPDPTAVEASIWLARHGMLDVVPQVEIHFLSSLPRISPRDETPARVLFLTLSRPFRGLPLPGVDELHAHAREVML